MDVRDIATQLGHASSWTTTEFYAKQKDYQMSPTGMAILNDRSTLRQPHSQNFSDENHCIVSGEELITEVYPIGLVSLITDGKYVQ
jgi:hypothetical protein